MQFSYPHRLLIGFFIVALCLASPVWAQKIKVKKIKGNSAIVESTVPLEEGQVYDLASEPISQSIDYKASGFRSRQNSFSLGGSFLSLKSSDYQRVYFALQARYGWNFTSLEFGGVGQLTSDDLGAGATTEFTGGGYFDYNLVPNREPKSFVYGITTLVLFGSKQFSAASGGGSATTLDLNLGGFLSWFLNSTSTALRIEAFVDSQQISTTTKQSNVLGVGSRALLLFYF